MPVSAAEIKQWTREDPVLLAQVMKYVLGGWPDHLLRENADKLKTYKPVQVNQQCKMFFLGVCLSIPAKGRKAVLIQLHEGQSSWLFKNEGNYKNHCLVARK